MLSKLISKINWLLNPPKLTFEEEALYFKQAKEVASTIKNCINAQQEPIKEIISLGENCNSAWYIKASGLKKASYPFDWIYSSPKIVAHCIQDNFNMFLDKKFIFKTRSGNSAGHSFYHSSLYNHRNPLKTNDDYKYYKRCIDRFEKVIKSDTEIIFVMTLVAEIHKRSGAGWAKGFNRNFELPINQNIDDMLELMSLLRSKNQKYRFLFIEQHTEQTPSIEIIDSKGNDFIWIKHTSFQRNTGVFFKHKTDDEVAKILFNALQ